MREKRNAYRIFVEKPEGKRPLRRQRCRQVDTVRMVWIELIWLRKAHVNTVMNLRVP
jgi:hypothetical protein